MTPFQRAFLSLYLAVFMSSLGLGILSPILPIYVDHFSASSFILGLVFGAYSAARTLFMPPVGILSDRWGRRPFIISGLLLFTLVSPLYALAGSALELALVRFLQGIAAAMLMPVAMAAIGDLSARGKEGFVMGSFTSAFFAGLGFGPLIGGYLGDRFSTATAFYGMGCLSLAALLFSFFALPEDLKRHGDRKPAQVRTGIRETVGDSPLMGLLFFRFTRAVGIGLVWVIMPLMAVKGMGVSSFQVGILLSVNTFITTVLQSPLGHLSDRLGHRKSLTLGTLLASAGIAGIGWCRGFSDLLHVSVAMGLAGAFIVPAGSALAVSLGRGRGMGKVMGLYNSSLSLGTMTGPILGGALLDAVGGRDTFVMGGVLGLTGWAVLMVLCSQRKMENGE